jgi:O-antigen/teichoic acid export membrane protein
MFLQRSDSKARFKELFYTRFAISVGLVFLINCISYFLPYDQVTQIGFSPQVRLGITIFSFTLITEAILYTSTAVFQRELSYEYFMISSIIGSLSTLLLVFLTSSFSSSLFLILGSFILGGILESSLAIYFTRQNLLPPNINFSFVKKLIRDTLPISLMLIFNLIYFRIDILILSLFKTSRDVAMYDLSYKFFDFLIALPLFLSNALYPSMIEKIKSGKSNIGIKNHLLTFLGFSFLVLVPAWFFAPLLSLIRQDFSPAVLPFRILLLSLPVFFITSILQWILIAKGQQKYLVLVYLILTVVNISLNLVFIPRFSYVAASIITGLCEIFVFVALWFKINNKDNE